MKLHINIVLLVVMVFSLFSCEDKDPVTQDIELVSGETLDLGDVPAGSSGSGEFVVKGIGLGFPIFLEIEGDNFSLDKDLFPAANINNKGLVTFSPERTATQETVSAVVMLNSKDITKTINVIANIVAPEPLEVGTQVYFNNMEFGLDHGDPISSSDFADSDNTHPTVMAVYDLAPSGNNASRIRTNKTSAMCDDNSIGDCGNAFRITGNGSVINIALSGLEAGRSYEVSYWVRPDGSSSRSMDVTVTGDTEAAFEDWGGLSDRSFYRKITRTGIADGTGNLEINFEYSSNSTSRTISVDDLKVVTL
ncbi:hypothetical protein [Algibacter sp. 2305UL17-15]|uniref:hypothetical protein n=1 Tax=Algibacter sp. 2305UL17-15 TaxID=3231268 RepID=UPI0034592849